MLLTLLTVTAVPSLAQDAPANKRDVPAVAASLIRTGHADSALAMVRRAIRADSTDANLWLALGEVYAALGRMTARISAFRRAHELQPAAADALAGLAESFLAGGQADSAGVYAWKFTKLGQWRNPEAYYLIGRVYEAQGQADSAIYYYRWALSLLPRRGLF
ncbi:MAG: tetratricopeptide repeat protein [Candidatus Zixiibacteriota bacterium]